MNNSSEFSNPEIFLPGAKGKPGERLFYIYAKQGSQELWIKTEKQQILALQEYFEQLLEEAQIYLSLDHYGTLAPEISSYDWVAGSISLGFDIDSERFLVVIEEFIPLQENTQDEFDQILALANAARARFLLRGADLEQFIYSTKHLEQQSRETCRLCGNPINVSGHFCPRNN